MEDYSLLIIKPEILGKKEDVVKSLERRGYEVLSDKECEGWDEFAKMTYTNVLALDEIEAGLKGYVKNNFGFNFHAILVKHKEGNTVERLNNEKGGFLTYQTDESEKSTLRGEFGLSGDMNEHYKDKTLVYNGIHTSINEEELQRNIEFLNIVLPE